MPGSVVSWAISKVQRVKIIMTGYLILQPFILKWPRKFIKGRFGRVCRTLILRWECGNGLCAKCSHESGVKSEEVKFNGFSILERFNELKGKDNSNMSYFALSTNCTCSSISQQIKQIIQIIERGRPFNSNITFCANPQKPFVARFLRKWKYRIFDHIVTIFIFIRILGSICLY